MDALLFDFFGTLVDYSASRVEQGYPRSAAILRDAGCDLGDDEWLARWASTSEELDAEADRTGVEFSMAHAFRAFAPVVDLDPEDASLADAFLAAYLAEWSTAVSLIPGVPALLTRLRRDGHRLVLVTNTHDAAMVRGHLDTMGLGRSFDAVVTSVEVGYRKPRPEIYAEALGMAGATAGDALFVGDSLVPDFVGPRRVGIDAYLIVPDGSPAPGEVPPDRVLRSVLDLETVVADSRGA